LPFAPGAAIFLKKRFPLLLFDDSKKLEKALVEEAVIAHVFERADEKWRQDLAAKADLERGLPATKTELRAEIANAKHDILRWMAGGFIAQTALPVAVLAFFR
jgi:hypothetical protein